MSAIKRAVLIAAALMLAAIGALAAVRYSTRLADRGLFERRTTLDGRLVQLVTAQTPIFGEGIDIISFDVKPGDHVNAGDTIGTYTVTTHKADLVRAENALNAAKDDLDYAVKTDAARTAELEKMMESAADADEARICELEIRKIALEGARRDVQAQQEIAALENALEARRTAGDPRPIKAPMSGVVMEISDTGAFKSGASAATIYDPDKVIARLNDPARLFKYGMEVEITLSSRGSKTATKGVVTSCDNVLPASAKSGAAYVTFDTSKIGPDFTGASATGITMRIADVVIISPMAITYREGRASVQLLDEDGVVRTRYITRGCETNMDVWVISGVNEGDKLIIK